MQTKTFYTIRFNDCDPFGHLNNSAYINYMLNAREDHLRDFHQLDMTMLYSKGLSWVVSYHEIAYLAPADYNETVCITSMLLKSGKDSLLVEMAMWDEREQKLKALLWTRFIHVDIKSGARSNHPEWFQQIADGLQTKRFEVAPSLKDRLTILRQTS